MGGDNFNKKTSESGKKPTNIADKLSTAINAGKKHRDSTPERLEKEAMKLLNALVDKFIDTYSIVSGIEKAATEGKTFLLIAKITAIKCDFDSLFWGQRMNSHILSVGDKGGSGLSAFKTNKDFGLLLRKEFSPAVQVRFQHGTQTQKNSLPDLLGGDDVIKPNNFQHYTTGHVHLYWD